MFFKFVLAALRRRLETRKRLRTINREAELRG